MKNSNNGTNPIHITTSMGTDKNYVVYEKNGRCAMVEDDAISGRLTFVYDGFSSVRRAEQRGPFLRQLKHNGWKVLITINEEASAPSEDNFFDDLDEEAEDSSPAADFFSEVDKLEDFLDDFMEEDED